MYRLGIDIGSTTIKMALVEVPSDQVQSTKEVRILATDYRRHNAEPMKVGQEMIEGILKAVSNQHSAINVGITGSVGMGCAQRLGIGFHQEVIAAAEVVKQLYPDVHCLVDIGGEDSKMIFFEEGCVPEMRMNGNCAGGTGAFIDQTATLLGVETSELNALAAKAEHITKTDPFDLMITIASLTVFTFVSLPMFQDLLSQTDDQVREYIAHRKSEVIRMVKKILKP